MDYEENHKPANAKNAKRFAVPVAVAAMIVLAIIALFMLSKNDSSLSGESPTQSNETSNEQTTPNTSETSDAIKDKSPANPDNNGNAANSPTNSAAYKNGTYELDSSYNTPGGLETIGVKVVLENVLLKEVVITPKAKSPDAKKYQGRFVSGYQSEVVGKNIDELNLDRVSGSSLTPKAFNEALEKIKQQAKV